MKKIDISPKNLKNRLEFAKQYSSWGTEEWWNVVFSHEAMFRIGNNGGIQRIRIKSGEIINNYHLTTQNDMEGIMIWE